MINPSKPSTKYHLPSTTPAFTIVELLVVIVVIGILAAITIVAYTGVSQKAIVSSLQSDLSNASTALKLFLVDNSAYPTTTSTNCSTNPTTTTNLCLKISSGNSYIGYSANNSASPQTFVLIAGNGNVNYKITSGIPPTQLATTMQSGVTPGAVLELRASKANGGLSQGINSPFTTDWTDTSGNGNNGTLTNMAGTTASGWAGSGTGGDPYRAVFDGVDDYAPFNYAPGLSDFSVESWAAFGPSSGMNGILIGAEANGPHGWGFYVTSTDVYAFLSVDGVTNYWHTSSPHTTNNVMHHFVGTFTRSGSILLYYDGGYSSSTDISTHSSFNASTTGNIGKYPGWIAAEQVSIVRIYPFTLTAAQVAANYAAGPN